MLNSIVSVKPLTDYRLWLRFDDGVEGEVDLAKLVRLEGIFEPLQKRAFFIRVAVNNEIGTICWPNGADLDPDVLYSKISGQPLPTFTDPMPASMD
jgi:hypothetical protein